jgi:hypothetical protein
VAIELPCAVDDYRWICTGEMAIPAGAPSRDVTLTRIVIGDDTGHTAEYAGSDLCYSASVPMDPCEPARVEIVGANAG